MRFFNLGLLLYIHPLTPNSQRVNNERDPVLIVLPTFFGYSHVHGEVHIMEPNYAVACPRQYLHNSFFSCYISFPPCSHGPSRLHNRRR
ncbi:hypothetical protein BKA82DRAFT_4149624 [Pisolithus tinctorius]|nr:hypothetical protein BKA82DRAFT_4149624 [Pisolithus tinctorius]